MAQVAGRYPRHNTSVAGWDRLGEDDVRPVSWALMDAYDAVLAKWPGAVEQAEVDTPFGATRVNICGRPDGTPLVLLHGGGSTSTVWFHNVGDLGRAHRIYAVDQINDRGRSKPNATKVGSRDDLMAWLDAVLTGLGLESVQLCGHSYGAWLALNYALHAPHRVTRLALLDPTTCFTGLGLAYKLRAIPLFLPGPGAPRLQAFLRWETKGAPLDPQWLQLITLPGESSGNKIVMPHLPDPKQLRAMRVPTLVLVAQKTRSHNPTRVAATAKALLPNVTVEVLPGATHHTIPTLGAADINDRLTRFLG